MPDPDDLFLFDGAFSPDGLTEASAAEGEQEDDDDFDDDWDEEFEEEDPGDDDPDSDDPNSGNADAESAAGALFQAPTKPERNASRPPQQRRR